MARTKSEVGFEAGGLHWEGDRLLYRMLGPVEVVRGGEVVDLGVRRQRALLALLLINANEVVSTDRIIDELWGDGTGRDREKALWPVVSRLRTALEPDRQKRSDGTILLSRPPGYVLAVEPDDIDVTRFESLAGEGRGLLDADPAAAGLALGEALGLWRGHAIEEFMYEAFAEAEVTRLEELRLGVLEDRIDADLRVGQARELVGELEALVRQHPGRERLAGHLMLALHLSGRQGDALRVFGAFRAHLADELGLDPPEELSRLEERIVLDDPELRQVGTGRVIAGRPEPGLSVRGYETRELIGSGSRGNVYRAFQPAVGREVAIKVIRADLANDPDFIRRFGSEASLIARLEHPHIVPLYDYWREPDAAYLVTRRYDRGSLRDVLEAGPLDTQTATSVVTQVAGALEAAHALGIAHGNVKPENVLIDAEDNAYLADFGPSWSERDDRFLAPEQASGSEPTPAADVYSLGRLTAYVLGEAKTPAAEVLARAAAPDPQHRYPDVASFSAALAASIDTPAQTVVTDVANPYRGLHAFGEHDGDRFFGRERLVERLLSRLGDRGPSGRFVALVGPSGSGKSSVVRAGVVPALRAGGVPGSEHWFITTTTPGRHPFEALEDALRAVAIDPPVDLLQRLQTDGIGPTVDALVAEPGAKVVLVIDQLEELFSLAPPHEADLYMQSLSDAISDRHSSLRVIATLRADFYDHPLRHSAFGERVRLGTEVITPMTPEELDRAITGPAAAVGVSFEPGLSATIAADMAGQSTALPLLQYALTELFEQRSGATVTAEAYHRLGGVSAALARRAEATHESLASDDRDRARDVFLRLVTLNEGGVDTRRRALVSELSDTEIGDCGPVLEAFGRHRLLSFDRDAVTRGPTAEIAHEALLSEWARLRRWIDDVRADLGAQRQLASALEDWQASDHDPDFLLAGARLARYEGWSHRPPVPLTGPEREYLSESSAADAAELETERRRVRRLRRLVAGVGLAMIAALIAGAIALQQRGRAEDEAADAREAASAAEAAAVVAEDAVVDAQLATLVSNSAAVRDDEPALALLLAVEAHARQADATTEQAVLNALSSASVGSLIGTTARLADDCTGSSLLFTSGGLPAEAATVDGAMIVRNPLTGEIRGEVTPPGQCAIGGAGEDTGAAQTLDGRTVWLGPDLDVVVELDLPTGGIQQSIGVLGEHVLLFEQAQESPPRAARARIVSPVSGETIGEPIEGTAELPIFIEWSPEESPDRTMFAMGFAAFGSDDGELVIAEAATGDVLNRIALPTCCPHIAWEAATGYVLLGFQDGLVWTLDPLSGQVLTETQLNLQRRPFAIGARPDGTLIVVTSTGILLVDRQLGVIDTPVELRNVNEAVIAPDGLVLVAGDSGALKIYDPSSRALTREIDLVRFERTSIIDGLVGVSSLNRDDDAAVIDLATGQRTSVPLPMPDGSTFVDGVVWPAPGGVWAVSPDLVLARWEDGAMVESLKLAGDEDVGALTYGDLKPAGGRWGDRYAVVGLRPDGTTEVTLATMRPGEAEVLLTIDAPGAQWAHPTPDGGVYVHGDDQVLRVYGAEGQLLDEWPTGAVDPYAFSLDPTGTKLAFGDLGGRRFDLSEEDPQIVLVNTTTGTTEAVPQDGIVSVISFNGDGTKLILAMFDGTVRYWDTETSALPTIVWTGSGTFDSEPGWYDSATDSIWTPAGGKLVNVPLDPTGWVELACSVVGRELTQDEWDRFVPGDEPLRSACENP